MSRVQSPSPTPKLSEPYFLTERQTFSKRAMGFYRQVEALMAVLAAVIVFVSCILMIGIPVKISLLISACVFLTGLVFGRRVAEIVAHLF
jgi:hypothetical protein